MLLLDEPVAGMNQEETEDTARHILQIRRELGITMILVEHQMDLVMDLADRVMVLDFGSVVAIGTPGEIQAHPRSTRSTSEGAIMSMTAVAAPRRVSAEPRRSPPCWRREQPRWATSRRSAITNSGCGSPTRGVSTQPEQPASGWRSSSSVSVSGDRIAIHSENRPEWLFADIGGQGIGAVPVGIYPTSPALPRSSTSSAHSEASVLIAEDEEQLDKVLEVRDRLPLLRHIVVIDSRTTVPASGRSADHDVRGARGVGHGPRAAMARRCRGTRPGSSTALIVYTSGTTGPPKGAMLSHRNLVAAANTFSEAFESTGRDEVLSYLPLCHIAERLSSAINALHVGYVVNFGRGGEFFAKDLRDVQPTLFLGVPRVWEKMAATVEIRMNDASGLKRRLYRWQSIVADCMAGPHGRSIERAQPVAPCGSLWLSVFRSLRDKLGLRRVRVALSGAAPIAPQLLEFFWAIGVPVREGYGQTENTAVATYTPADDVRLGKVGKALARCRDPDRRRPARS